MSTPNEPKICLNMIVKNEGPRMARLFETLKDLVDEVVISDTGSTDDTIEVTKKKCEELGWKCYIDITPFKNFEFNRTHSINVAVANSDADFLLFLDADMKLAKGPLFSKKALLSPGSDVYSFLQKTHDLEYSNMRLIRRTMKDLKCVGVTHEHYSFDSKNCKMSNVPREILFIDDIGDGGSKANKFERDHRLLKDGLRKEPDNARYMFYLAETCRYMGKFEESIFNYKRRVKAGGWDEEVYRALYGITMCYGSMKKPEKMDAYAMRAFLFRPTRTESIYYACKWHRERGENLKAYSFLQLGYRIPKPQSDVLFVETAPYEWGWNYEYSILAYYVEFPNKSIYKNPYGSLVSLRRIISSLGSLKECATTMQRWIYDNLYENTKFYIELLPASFPRKDMFPMKIDGFSSSTPGVLHLLGKSFRHARHVNYKIVRETGSYIMSPDDTVDSRCSFLQGSDGEWKELRVDMKGLTLYRKTPIRGIEDIRFFTMAPESESLTSMMPYTSEPPQIPQFNVYGMGTTVELSTDGKLQMVIVGADLENGVCYPIRQVPRVLDCEKNHAPILGTNLCVHSWGPRLKIYDMVKSTATGQMVWVHDISDTEIPAWFLRLRGSSPGIPWPSSGKTKEYWFICHSVFFETPRRYVHNIVRLSAETFRPVGMSIPFNFDETKIEFSAGIALEDDDKTLVIGYSIFDSCSKEIQIPVSWLMGPAMITVASSAEV